MGTTAYIPGQQTQNSSGATAAQGAVGASTQQTTQQVNPLVPAVGGAVVKQVVGNTIKEAIPSASEIIPGPVGPQSSFPVADSFSAIDSAPQLIGNNVNAVGQTVIGAGQAIPSGYVAVGTDAATGGTMIAPGTAAQATGFSLQSVVAPIAIAHGAYNIIDSFGQSNPVSGAMSGAEIGAGIGSFVPVPGATLIGAGIGAAVGGLIGNIKTGKHVDQVARDRYREGLQQLGLTDAEHKVMFSDGSVFDMGKDGGARLLNYDGGERPFYNTDASHPYGHQAVGWVNPLAVTLAHGNVKLANDFAGYFSNAILNSSDSMEEVRLKAVELYQHAGISPAEMLTSLNSLRTQGQITDQEFAAFASGIDTVFKANSGTQQSIEEYVAQIPPSGVTGGGSYTPKTVPVVQSTQDIANVPV